MLEWDIVSDNRSFEALAVIGSGIGLIYWIDKNWLGTNAGRLFHLEGIKESPPMAQGWAAWNAFLVWVRPHIEFYKLFREQFAYAVTQSARVNLAERTSEQPMHHLGEHLMILYGRGQLGLDDDGGLLRRFLADSHPDVRRHAVGFVGRSIEGDEKLPEEVVSRFQDLWSLYWAGEARRMPRRSPMPGCSAPGSRPDNSRSNGRWSNLRILSRSRQLRSPTTPLANNSQKLLRSTS